MSIACTTITMLHITCLVYISQSRTRTVAYDPPHIVTKHLHGWIFMAATSDMGSVVKFGP